MLQFYAHQGEPYTYKNFSVNIEFKKIRFINFFCLSFCLFYFFYYRIFRYQLTIKNYNCFKSRRIFSSIYKLRFKKKIITENKFIVLPKKKLITTKKKSLIFHKKNLYLQQKKYSKTSSQHQKKTFFLHKQKRFFKFIQKQIVYYFCKLSIRINFLTYIFIFWAQVLFCVKTVFFKNPTFLFYLKKLK